MNCFFGVLLLMMSTSAGAGAFSWDEDGDGFVTAEEPAPSEAFPPTVFAGVDIDNPYWTPVDGVQKYRETQAGSQADRYLSRAVSKSGGVREMLADTALDVVASTPGLKERINLVDSQSGMHLSDQVRAAVLKLHRIQHDTIGEPGGGDVKYNVRISVVLSWILIGGTEETERTDAPEVVFSQTVFHLYRQRAENEKAAEAALPRWYREAIREAVTKLLQLVADRGYRSVRWNHQIPVLVKKVKFHGKSKEVIDRLVDSTLEADRQKLTRVNRTRIRESFQKDLTLYLQRKLVEAVRKESRLRNVVVLPNSDSVTDMRRVWGELVDRHQDLRSVPPVIRRVDPVCEVVRYRGVGSEDERLMKGFWVESSIYQVSERPSQLETEYQKGRIFETVSISRISLPIQEGKSMVVPFRLEKRARYAQGSGGTAMEVIKGYENLYPDTPRAFLWVSMRKSIDKLAIELIDRLKGVVDEFEKEKLDEYFEGKTCAM